MGNIDIAVNFFQGFILVFFPNIRALEDKQNRKFYKVHRIQCIQFILARYDCINE